MPQNSTIDFSLHQVEKDQKSENRAETGGGKMVSNGMIAHAAFGVAIVVIILILIVRCFKKQKAAESVFQLGKLNSFEKGVASLHAPPITAASVAESARRRPSLHGFRRAGGGNKTLFSWADNPSLVTDAVETGWVRFAFTLSPSVKPTSLLGMCAAGDSSVALDTEISWEIGHAAVDFMQKIRLNPGLRVQWIRSNSNSSSTSSIISAIRTALPFPGPACAFPQEAYFEIIVLSCREEDEEESKKIREGERMKLIGENGNGEHRFSDSNIAATGAREDGRGGREEGVGGLFLAVGLTVGGLLPMKLPGSYPGSIGFVSNGLLHHDGNKLVSELDKEEWGHLTGKVIGCGFSPSEKKVLFTVDAELVHSITCTTEEYGAPLYPTLAANCDITVMVNNGQSPFKYVTANANRRANPCFQVGTDSDDSKEFFSMGRIDSQWRNRSGARGSVYMGNGNGNARVKDYDDESDVDELFEIILESKSNPSPVGR